MEFDNRGTGALYAGEEKQQTAWRGKVPASHCGDKSGVDLAHGLTLSASHALFPASEDYL